MFCNVCGTQNPDEANFCWKCGKSFKPKMQSVDLKLETCELIWKHVDANVLDVFVLGPRERLVARAIGSEGEYIVAQSAPVRYKQKDEVRNTIVKKLVQDGWEPVTGNLFHRRIK